MLFLHAFERQLMCVDCWRLFLCIYVTLRLTKFSIKHYLLTYINILRFFTSFSITNFKALFHIRSLDSSAIALIPWEIYQSCTDQFVIFLELTCSSTICSKRRQFVFCLRRIHVEVVIFSESGVSFKVTQVNAKSLTSVRCQQMQLIVSYTRQ